MVVLGIETSCDETALALVADGREVLRSRVVSSIKAHQRYGGVVPEIASRAHLEFLTLQLELLLSETKKSHRQIDRIAVTHGPGLPGSLLMGVTAAKALGLAWGKETLGVNHLQAHLYAALMPRQEWGLDSPMMGLVISGGHTALVRMEGIHRFHLLGQTRDDAVGEAFDKVAKLLGLGFPGGPEIERVAKEGNPTAFRFTRPKIKSGSPYDFSYSGIKTAVLYKIREKGFPGPTKALGGAGTIKDSRFTDFAADMAASFQRFVVEELVEKTLQACRAHRTRRLVVGGGVIANSPLRERLQEVCSDLKIDLAIPPTDLCTDNGAMVAGLGHHRNPMSPWELTAVPDLTVELN